LIPLSRKIDFLDSSLFLLFLPLPYGYISAFDEIAASPSLEQTIRVGTADVELVVQAANNNN
jgi:hypothetical protein